MTTHLFKIKKLGEDGKLQDFEFNIPANESEMKISENLMNPELTFKIHCEFIKGEGGQHIALTDDEGRWNKCDLFKINGFNPSVKTPIGGDYYLWLSVAQLGGGKRKKSKRRKSKKRRYKKKRSKRRS